MSDNSTNGQYKSRDIFGVQLEVLSLLLNTELMKLATLQAELDSTQSSQQQYQMIHPPQDQYLAHQEEQQFELICAISRIQAQVEQLEREYTAHALGALKSAPLRGSGKSNRSQPAIGLKYLPKLRPSIFGTVASSPAASHSDSSPSSSHLRKSLPQTSIGSTTTTTGTATVVTGNNTIIPSNGSKSTMTMTTTTSASSNGPPSYSCTSSTAAAAGAAAAVSSPSDSNSHSSHVSIDHGSNPKLVNNWDHTLVYEDTTLKSATLEALIKHFLPTDVYYADRAFIFAFLLSSRLYIRPHELLGRVYQLSLCQLSQHNSAKYVTAKETKIVSNVVRLLGEWAELFPYDFRDERMMAHVRNITQKCVAIDPPVRKEVSQLLTTLLARLTALERYEDFLHRINTEAALGEPLTAPSILSICPNPTMLAQQLTHIELERLSHIGPEEFVQAFAKDNVQVETKYKDMKTTRNLECYVQWFNRLSYYVATEICKVTKKKNRVRIIEYWIEVARESFNIGNFNSLMAIIAGLNMSPVSRLKKTFQKVSKSQLSVLECQMDPTGNFSSYRSTLKAAVWRSMGATDERQRIVIPFFSLLVKDLYFLNEGCASKLSNGHINFEKFWQFAKQVTEVITWQQITCSFPKVQTVLSSLHTAPVFNENALCLASFECEPADNAQEKERLKYLRRQEANYDTNIEITDCLPKSKHFRKNNLKKQANGSVSSSSNGDSSEINSKT